MEIEKTISSMDERELLQKLERIAQALERIADHLEKRIIEIPFSDLEDEDWDVTTSY